MLTKSNLFKDKTNLKFTGHGGRVFYFAMFQIKVETAAAVKSVILLSLHFYNSEYNDTWNQWNALQ